VNNIGNVRFHTTMVLTQRTPWGWTIGWIWCFHTNMVLTQLWRACQVCRPPHVSIPLWFSRNADIIFQPVNQPAVSIPLWFSRNEVNYWSMPGVTMFPYHYGSHATTHSDMRRSGYSSSFHTTMVLTQQS